MLFPKLATDGLLAKCAATELGKETLGRLQTKEYELRSGHSSQERTVRSCGVQGNTNDSPSSRIPIYPRNLPWQYGQTSNLLNSA